MKKKNFFLRKVATGVACLAVTVMFSGCEKPEKDDPVNPDTPVGELTELTSPITQNTTLKDLGLPIDYVYKGSSLLQVKNNAVLTIEDSVTIQFTNAGGGIEIMDGATIKALGTANQHIQFIGAKSTKDAWNGITVNSNTENQFVYCDFINGGKNATDGVLHLQGAKVGISHCSISGGLGYGMDLESNSAGGQRACELTTFDNNVIAGMDKSPVQINSASYLAWGKFDLTSDLTNNAQPYILIDAAQIIRENVTINETSVPYYFGNTNVNALNARLTINAGVTVCFKENCYFLDSGSSQDNGLLIIQGTAEKPVTFTRLPNTAYHWGGIEINHLSGSVIEHCNIEYAGGNVNSRARSGIKISAQTGLTLRNVHISNSANYGIEFAYRDYGFTHSNVTFANCANGNVYYNSQVYNSLEELP